MSEFNKAVDQATKAQVEKLTEEEKAEALLLCMWLPKDERPFDDCIEGQCHDCGTPIIWRPHADALGRKVCMSCGIERMKGGHA